MSNLTVDPVGEDPSKITVRANLTFNTPSQLEDLFFQTSDSVRATVLREESVRASPDGERVRLSPTNATTTNASVTLEFVQTSQRSRTFETFVAGDGWAFFDREFLRIDTALGSDVTVVDRTRFDTERDTVSGDAYTLVGSHTTHQRSTSGQSFRLIVPDAASLAEDEAAILDALADARKLVPSDHADPAPRLDVFVSPRRTPNQAVRGDVVVGDRMALGGPPDGLSNTWIHEFTHTRQDFGQPTRQMVWFTEGSATYYEHLSSHRSGDATFESLHTYPPEVSEEYTSDTLSDRSTWSSWRTPYVKGARVLYALDVRIRNVTDGEKTVHDVFRRLNAHQNDDPGARLTYSTFEATVERVAGRSLDDWLDRHVTTSAAPTPDRRPDLFGASPPDENGTSSATDSNSTSGDAVTAESASGGGPVSSYDADGDGIDVQELGAAAADYARGNLSIVDLGQVSASYARS